MTEWLVGKFRLIASILLVAGIFLADVAHPIVGAPFIIAAFLLF